MITKTTDSVPLYRVFLKKFPTLASKTTLCSTIVLHNVVLLQEWETFSGTPCIINEKKLLMKKATVEEIVNKHLIVETFSLFRKTFVKRKHEKTAKRKLCQSQTIDELIVKNNL